MFTEFFYLLKQLGIPVSPTSFLRLQKGLHLGLVSSIDDFYTAARSILVKSERYFDLYDQAFAHHFEGAELKPPDETELSEVARAMLEEWLKNPKELADLLGVDEASLGKLSPEELVKYFLDRLKEQTEAHHGGSKWIGTGGTSPPARPRHRSARGATAARAAARRAAASRCRRRAPRRRRRSRRRAPAGSAAARRRPG